MKRSVLLAAVLSGPTTIAQRILATKRANLIQYLPLDDAVGTTTVRDASGNGRTGTATAVTFGSVAGPDGRPCASFNGSTSKLTYGGVSFGAAWNGQSLTCVLWAKPADATAWTDGLRRLLQLASNSATEYLLFTSQNAYANSLNIQYKAGGTAKAYTVSTIVETGWQMLAVTVDLAHDTLQVYFNGRPIGPAITGLGTWSVALDANRCVLGAATTTPTFVWRGLLADWAVWNTPLTAGEIAQIYLASLGYPLNSAYATNAAAALTTPTYDATGEATHPSVVYFDTAWNGYKYWMAMTPYANAASSVERPSILASNDGDTWEVPVGATNPIDPAWDSDSDTDLYYESGTLYCVYRRRNQDVVLSSTTDGVNWSVPVLLFTTAASADASPSLLKVNGQYVIWSVNASIAAPYQIERRTCATLTGTWSDPVVCTIQFPIDARISNFWWHLDVSDVGGVLWAVITTSSTITGYGLFLAVSTDGGLTWTCAKNPFLTGASGKWDANLYRASLLKVSGGFDLFYGGYAGTAPSVWHIGRTTITVPGL